MSSLGLLREILAQFSTAPSAEASEYVAHLMPGALQAGLLMANYLFLRGPLERVLASAIMTSGRSSSSRLGRRVPAGGPTAVRGLLPLPGPEPVQFLAQFLLLRRGGNGEGPLLCRTLGRRDTLVVLPRDPPQPDPLLLRDAELFPNLARLVLLRQRGDHVAEPDLFQGRHLLRREDARNLALEVGPHALPLLRRRPLRLPGGSPSLLGVIGYNLLPALLLRCAESQLLANCTRGRALRKPELPRWCPVGAIGQSPGCWRCSMSPQKFPSPQSQTFPSPQSGRRGAEARRATSLAAPG